MDLYGRADSYLASDKAMFDAFQNESMYALEFQKAVLKCFDENPKKVFSKGWLRACNTLKVKVLFC